MIPLYNGATALPPVTDRGNKALLFDKFYDWDNSDKEKSNNLDRITGLCGEGAAIERETKRMCDLVGSLGGDFAIFTNRWHFVAGMGIDHPLENGMLWHPTLGTPYLPGSSVKGMVRAYCEVWTGWEKEKIERVFGASADQDNQGASGEYIFFDAIPVSRPTLATDIMTPHMGKWYEKGGEIQHNWENTPGDWHSPVPVPFLVVKQISLLFAIAPMPRKKDNAEELTELMEVLGEALEWVGAGAKTAAGYGRFEKDTSKTSKYKEAIELRYGLDRAIKEKNVEFLKKYIRTFPQSEGAENAKKCLYDLEQIAKANRYQDVNEKFDRALQELLNRKNNQKQYEKLKAKFLKKWNAEKNNKKSPYILEKLKNLF